MDALIQQFSSQHPVYSHLLAWAIGAGMGQWMWGKFLDSILPTLTLKGLGWLKAHGMTVDQEKAILEVLKKEEEIVAGDVAAQEAKKG